MTMTSKEMVNYLTKNGFEKVRQNGSHLFMRNYTTRRCTTVPCHAKDLKKGTEAKILKLAGLK